MLSTSGSVDQLLTCGFKTVKQQMMLRKLMTTTYCSSAEACTSSGGSTMSLSSSNSPMQPTRKLKKKELNSLSPQDKSVYLMM